MGIYRHMKFKIEKKYLQIGLVAFTVIAAAICFYYLIFHGDRFAVRLKEFFTVLSPVIYGIVTAYLLTPLVNAIERSVLTALWGRNGKPITSKGKKQMRALSIFLSICIAILLIYAFFSILIPNILRSIRSISIQFPYYIRNLTNWSNKFLEDNPDIEKLFVQFLDTYSEEFTNYVNNTIVPKMETIVRQVSLSMISLVKILWNFLIGFIIAIYLLFSKENFAAQCKKITYAVLSQKTANQFIKDIRFTSDHMAVLGSVGILPMNKLIRDDYMKNTLHWVWDNWNWGKTWGWDYPMTAMNATRLGEPEKAVGALLMDKRTNTYLLNGHNYQDARLRCYLPGNGGLLTAVALMCAGWDGCQVKNPGFPQDGKWDVRWEGLSPMP